MRPVLFHLGPIPIYAYGLTLAVAFVVGSWIAARRAKKAGVSEDLLYSMSTWAFVAAILGSRLFHIVVEKPELLSRPGEWLKIWEGGLVFYGGFIGAVLSSIIFGRVKKISFWSLADFAAPAIAIGHGFVRIGCFLNGCCYGKAVSWGLVFPSRGDGVHRHPTQLYEAFAGLLLLLGVLGWEKRFQKVKGELVLVYAAAYGLVRFLLEFLRDDDRGGRFLTLSLSQWIGLAGLLAGVAGVAWLRKKEGDTVSPQKS